MNKPAITVLLPTFDHGPLIRHALRSAQQQSIPEIEILVVGDGAPAATAATVAEIGAEDPRVRWFGFDKGPRHGEVHRHRVLSGAQGDIVCYLADDDLWLPDHLVTMQTLLAAHDMAFAVSLKIAIDGGVSLYNHDMALPRFRSHIMANHNRMPLSTFGHRLDAYRRLPHGWRASPPDINTDIYMYQQFLAEDHSSVSAVLPTVLNFPAPDRVGYEDRDGELERWIARIAEADWEVWMLRQALSLAQSRAGREEAKWMLAEERRLALEDRLASVEEATPTPTSGFLDRIRPRARRLR